MAMAATVRMSGVIVVHVLPTIEPTDLEAIWMTVDPAAREEHTVQAINERLAKKNASGVQIQILFGEPGHAIAEFAKQRAAARRAATAPTHPLLPT